MVEILTQRFLLRELRESDVTHRYLSWFADADAKRNISAAAAMDTIAALKQYVCEREGRADVLFLGIFCREDGMHIGNIKYEPIDTDLGVAVMGILIGEPSFRGKGVAREVLLATGAYLREQRAVRVIELGVHATNAAAIAAYERVGFRRDREAPSHADSYIMDWYL
jgi:[ribosomal protein S5]-alanine N-acetyltransferase